MMSTPKQIHGHPDVVERELNTRHHDGKETLFCRRCGTHVPRSDPEEFKQHDCDQRKRVRDGIMNGLSNAGK